MAISLPHGDTEVRVLILHALRREGGGTRRLKTWQDLFAEVGAETELLSVLPGNSTGVSLSLGALREVVSSRAAPESIVWSRSELVRRISRTPPDVAVCVTARSFSPFVVTELKRLGARNVVVDLVDPLSVSYSQRARILHGASSFAYRVLASAAARSEKQLQRTDSQIVVAGWDDSRSTGAMWLPILLEERSAEVARSDQPMAWEAVFFGSLDYAPNIEAVERLAAHIWPRVRLQLPDATIAVAGRRASRRVLKAVKEPGIRFIGEFDDLNEIAGQALVAVSPLVAATGMQIKVLDAAQRGLAQVVSPAAVRGFEPSFPARIAEDDDAFADAIVDLIGDSRERDRLASSARDHVTRRYSVKAWSDFARGLME
jgi:hypothetical protein